MGYISLYTINIFLAKTLYPPPTYSMYGPLKNLFTSACLKLNYGTTKEGGGRSTCQWTGNEDFQYSISRFLEKYDRETVFLTLDGAGNYWKKLREIGI